MADRARIRINLTQREIEVEGTDIFVSEWIEKLKHFLVRDQQDLPLTPGLKNSDTQTNTRNDSSRLAFGQFIQGLNISATDVDRMLATGYWVQLGNANECYTTGETSRLLSDQGFKIGNPSQCVKQALLAKRCFMIAKGQYRVSATGRQYLRHLMGDLIEGPPIA